MEYEDNCDICNDDSVYISDFGYTLCYQCFLDNPQIQKDMNNRLNKENILEKGY